MCKNPKPYVIYGIRKPLTKNHSVKTLLIYCIIFSAQKKNLQDNPEFKKKFQFLKKREKGQTHPSLNLLNLRDILVIVVPQLFGQDTVNVLIPQKMKRRAIKKDLN